mmetsp:Transcript_28085/g.66343  ORF Transcript_28085/g.66343 Transcript_28085/m.66343 type:complete len:200 (+) Transcript_28085:669-1268(+)
MSVLLLEASLGGRELLPCHQDALVGLRKLPTSTLVHLLACALQLIKPPLALLELSAQLLVVGQVALEWLNHVEVHVPLQLGHGAVGGVRARDLVRGLPQHATIGHHALVLRASQVCSQALRQAVEAVRKMLHALHEGLNAAVHGAQGLIELAKLLHHPLEHRVWNLAVKPSLLGRAGLHWGPFRIPRGACAPAGSALGP